MIACGVRVVPARLWAPDVTIAAVVAIDALSTRLYRWLTEA